MGAFRRYLPVIILFSAIFCCVGVLWMLDTKNIFPSKKPTVLGQQTKSTPLANSLSAIISPTPYKNPQLFQDKKMHITFVYPDTLHVEKVNDKLISVYDKKIVDIYNSMYIYVTSVNTKIADVSVPFSINGNIKENIKIKKDGFSARLVTFDAKETSQLFFLRSNAQVIVIRPPQNGSIDPQIVYAIIQSIEKYK